jgi:hypothetical protein
MVPLCNVHRANIIVHELLECYNVAKEEYDEKIPRMYKYLKQNENEQ